MSTINYRGIEVTYEPEHARFSFSVRGSAFSTLTYSSIFTIIDEYLEVA